MLLHNFEGGFVAPAAILAYAMTTLAVVMVLIREMMTVNIFVSVVFVFVVFGLIYRYGRSL